MRRGELAAAVDWWIVDQRAAMAVARHDEIARHVLTEQRQPRGVGAIAHGKRTAERIAGVAERRRARGERHSREVDVVRPCEARDRAPKLRVVEHHPAAAGEGDGARVHAAAALDLEPTARNRGPRYDAAR